MRRLARPPRAASCARAAGSCRRPARWRSRPSGRRRRSGRPSSPRAVFSWVVLRPGVRLGDAEAGLVLAARSIGGSMRLLLLLAAEHHDRVQAEHVDVHRRGAPTCRAPDSAIVCIMSAASVTPSPAPPYASSMHMPSQPSSAIAR